MSETAIKVLMIDDDEDDALLVRKLLGSVPSTHYQLDWVSTYQEGLKRLCEDRDDICLLDYHLGARNGLELLGEARTCQSQMPVILMTGLGAEEVDRAAMAAGALDYLSKGELTASHLERSIRYGLQQSKTLQALRQAQENLERKVEARTAELAASEEALRRANERLLEADRRKDEFLAMLAHELRNPLAPIRNAVQILRTYCDANCSISAQTARQREMIERQVTHMSRLLDDLLDVSRITRGKIQLRREKLDLRTVTEQAAESMRTLFDVRKQQFYYQAVSSPLPIDGDPTRLEQVMRNLLHNASKYTEPGGCIWMDVEIAAADGESQAVVRVRDSGGGIVPELLEHIFEPFVQAEQGLARSQGGLGIGLSMVKNLVQLHGGWVEAHSQGLGQGSEFVVHLPLIAEMVEKPGAARPAEQPPGDQEAKDNVKRVLVVDDNEDAAASLGDLLGLWGHAARTVHEGRQALAVAREWRPEVILLDIGLPGMDGYEVARRLRAEPANAGAYLVALTGYGAEEDRQRSMAAGFDRHLTKPVDLADLRALLQQAE